MPWLCGSCSRCTQFLSSKSCAAGVWLDPCWSCSGCKCLFLLPCHQCKALHCQLARACISPVPLSQCCECLLGMFWGVACGCSHANVLGLFLVRSMCNDTSSCCNSCEGVHAICVVTFRLRWLCSRTMQLARVLPPSAHVLLQASKFSAFWQDSCILWLMYHAACPGTVSASGFRHNTESLSWQLVRCHAASTRPDLSECNSSSQLPEQAIFKHSGQRHSHIRNAP